MGLFDLPAPLFGAIDGFMAMLLPGGIRLVIWGLFAGWLTMVFYRKISNQDRIGTVKKEQKAQQAALTNFDGDFDELLPLIRSTLGLGFRQLGLAIGPALLGSIPVLFLVAWVAGQFGYQAPAAGDSIEVSSQPDSVTLEWTPSSSANSTDSGWSLQWPTQGEPAVLTENGQALLEFPLSAPVPVIHKKRWWNVFFANPLGYLDDNVETDQVDIGLAPQQFLPFGPAWLRGWMFSFFGIFLIASLGFKFVLKID